MGIKIRLNVVDRSGEEHEVDASARGSLMEVLRQLDYGVAAICGGICSCATCHVYVGNDWVQKLLPPHSNEHELVSELVYFRETSRLACQIKLSEALDGLHLTIAPEE